MNTIVLAASNNTDNLNCHQSMKAPEKREFKKAIIKEVNTFIERKHWQLILRE